MSERWRRVLGLCLFLAVVIAIAASDATHAFIRELLEHVRKLIVLYPVTGKIAFVLLAALSGMLVFFSSAIVIPVAVFTWGKPITLALLSIGWLLGGCASYAIGRFPGRRLFKKLLSSRQVKKYEKAISNETPFAIVLLFQVALQSEIPGYLLGAARYDFAKYLLALAIVEVPYALAAIYLGESFIGRNYALLFGLGAAAILVSAVALHLVHRHMR